jgi:hypothetical protein
MENVNDSKKRLPKFVFFRSRLDGVERSGEKSETARDIFNRSKN